MLYALLCAFLFCFAFLAISHVIMPASSEVGSNQGMETRGAAFELSHGPSRSMIKRALLYRDFLCSTWTIGERYFFPRDTDSNVTHVHEAIKLEGPRAYVINRHSEQVDFVGCGRKCPIEVDRFYDKELTQDDR